MPVALKTLVGYTDALLEAARFDDYAPNGLQVEGRGEVGKIVAGVTASLALIESAVERKADALLVHHGYFWKGESPCVSGIKRRRLGALLRHEISLIAYHLPLDDHPNFGNNAQLADLLGLSVKGRFGSGRGPALAMHGALPREMGSDELAEWVTERLGRAPQHIRGRAKRLRNIGWCTGAAQDYIEAAAALDLDAYLSGEISEQTVHLARETGIHYLAAGHHATERYGVKALAAHLAAKFAIECEFVDVDNPV